MNKIHCDIILFGIYYIICNETYFTAANKQESSHWWEQFEHFNFYRVDQVNVSTIETQILHCSAGHYNAKASTDAISNEYPVVDHWSNAIVATS